MEDLEELIETVYRIDNIEDLSTFFHEIFTEKEKKDLSLRWKLMKMLKEGFTQRKIASTLHISLCKITRGAKILKDENSISNKYLSSGGGSTVNKNKKNVSGTISTKK